MYLLAYRMYPYPHPFTSIYMLSLCTLAYYISHTPSRSLSIHLTIAPYQYILPTHFIIIPNQHTLSTHHPYPFFFSFTRRTSHVLLLNEKNTTENIKGIRVTMVMSLNWTKGNPSFLSPECKKSTCP